MTTFAIAVAALAFLTLPIAIKERDGLWIAACILAPLSAALTVMIK